MQQKVSKKFLKKKCHSTVKVGELLLPVLVAARDTVEEGEWTGALKDPREARVRRMKAR